MDGVLRKKSKFKTIISFIRHSKNHDAIFPQEKSDARSHKSQFEVLSKQEVGQKIRENVGDSRNQDTIDSFIQRSKKIMMQCFHGRKAMQDTTRPRWLKWTTYHLIVYVVMSDFNVSLAASPVLYTVGL